MYGTNKTNQLYPSNEAAIRLLLEPFKVPEKFRSERYRTPEYSFNIKHILDPSAGTGNILNFIQNSIGFNRSKPKLYAIEIEPNLQAMLKGQGHRVIDSDFLNYECHYNFDLIIMNPPFNKGDQHLLKAWEILKEGHISCILNAQTIKNPNSINRQKVVELIEQHGSVTFHEGVFIESEHPTEVEIAVIQLDKKAAEKTNPFESSNFNTEEKAQELISKIDEGGSLEQSDYLDALIRSYNEGIKKYDELLSKLYEVKSFLNVFAIDNYFDPKSMIVDSLKNADSKNDFLDSMKSTAWLYIFSKLDVQKYMTRGVKNKFKEFINQQSNLEFTRDNIFELISGIMQNSQTIINEAMIEVFDKLCSHDAKNKLHYTDGWVTNSAYKVNHKIIMPRMVRWTTWDSEQHKRMYGGKFNVHYSNVSYLEDIERVLCHLTATPFPVSEGEEESKVYTGIRSTLDRHFKKIGHLNTGDPFDSLCYSHFFKIRFYKKGTIHITFKDRKLCDKLNRAVAIHRGWLPEDVNN